MFPPGSLNHQTLGRQLGLNSLKLVLYLPVPTCLLCISLLPDCFVGGIGVAPHATLNVEWAAAAVDLSGGSWLRKTNCNPCSSLKLTG